MKILLDFNGWTKEGDFIVLSDSIPDYVSVALLPPLSLFARGGKQEVAEDGLTMFAFRHHGEYSGDLPIFRYDGTET